MGPWCVVREGPADLLTMRVVARAARSGNVGVTAPMVRMRANAVSNPSAPSACARRAVIVRLALGFGDPAGDEVWPMAGAVTDSSHGSRNLPPKRDKFCKSGFSRPARRVAGLHSRRTPEFFYRK